MYKISAESSVMGADAVVVLIFYIRYDSSSVNSRGSTNSVHTVSFYHSMYKISTESSVMDVTRW